jgi:phage antirepressor YoqD-like protein
MLKELRKTGILMNDNTPYQAFIKQGYFKLKLTTQGTTTYVTPKGIEYLSKPIKKVVKSVTTKSL